VTLPVLVAPDSFKGTFSAAEVAGAIAAGLRSADREAVELPVADGGEGTMGVLAQASGLGLVAEDERDAWAASTRGTGELIALAVEAGAEHVLVTVGGSATSDGGAGALDALEEAGVRPDLEVLCDVRTVYEKAPSVFGPQKGADPALVKRLERRLDELAEKLPRDPRGVPMTGAAGGLSGGLWGGLGARLVPGAAYVLDAIGFDAAMKGSAFVVTGEGCLDSQTLEGKIVGEVATRCRQGGVACHAIVGRDDLDPFEERIIDLASVSEATGLAEMEATGRRLV
jgi:glycerate 2-kinase